MSGFAVIADSRYVGVIALVDRSMTTSRWWTAYTPGLVMRFRLREAAEQMCRNYVYNNARVAPYEDAVRMIREQAEAQEFGEACAACEEGWDGHKEIKL